MFKNIIATAASIGHRYTHTKQHYSLSLFVVQQISSSLVSSCLYFFMLAVVANIFSLERIRTHFKVLYVDWYRADNDTSYNKVAWKQFISTTLRKNIFAFLFLSFTQSIFCINSNIKSWICYLKNIFFSGINLLAIFFFFVINSVVTYFFLAPMTKKKEGFDKFNCTYPQSGKYM